MSFAIVNSRARIGVASPEVIIEVHISNGLPAFQIVGLPETSVREARDRVRSAIINSQFQFPQTRITVNLAPADLPKEGGRFDLPIAIGILAASKQLPAERIKNYEFYGELSLNGELRNILGAIPSVIACRDLNHSAVLPKQNAHYAAFVEGAQCYGADSLLQVFHHLNGQYQLPLAITPELQAVEKPNADSVADLSDIIGQQQAKRALEIAAAGGHNLLLLGPPGTGKSMLAERLITLLPPMEEREAIETLAIRSINESSFDPNTWRQRPFRHPHHTASGVALVGGGSIPKPGEISLAHNGVLFLDELTEFDRKVIDVLREPMETGYVSISRAAQQADFPARFQLVAAFNPSPTGSIDDGRTNPEQIQRYLSKLSGPFLDRIEMQVDVPLLPKGSLTNIPPDTESSSVVKQRVIQSQKIMRQRAGRLNAQLSGKEITQVCDLSRADNLFLEQVLEKLRLSIRSYHKILKVARTIADLAQSPRVERTHIAEALSYRAMDKLLANLKH